MNINDDGVGSTGIGGRSVPTAGSGVGSTARWRPPSLNPPTPCHKGHQGRSCGVFASEVPSR